MLHIDRSDTLALVALALFFFVFLGSEFFFDSTMALMVDASGVVGSQSLILGASVIGFLLFPAFDRRVPRTAQRVLALASTIVVAACLAIILQRPSALAAQASGCMAFLLLGCVGGKAHWAVAQSFGNSPVLSRLLGVAYAAGLALQFANNMAVADRFAETLVLGAATTLLVALLFFARKDAATSARIPPAANAVEAATARGATQARKGLVLILVVFLMTCMFGTLDNAVTLADAQGSISVETWPRLLLAASGIAAGFVFDAARRFRGAIMFCIMLLSTISILIMEGGGNPLVGLIVFYLGSGFYVVFFTTIFMRLATSMRVPQLWAGMGRAANNACAILTAAPSLALVQTNDPLLIAGLALVLFVAVTAALCASGMIGLHGENQEAEAPVAAPAPSSFEDRVDRFARENGLTPRETEVLAAVVGSDEPLKVIAAKQDVTLRTVQHHLTSIYRKTETQTRAGLINRFLS